MTKQETTIAVGPLEMIDPEVLRLDGNVRTDVAITKQFVASIRENGVLVPILAVRGDDGEVTVRAGQRRTLAAREAGLPSVPVWVIDASTSDADADTIDRLVTQISENDHRQALSTSDRVRGIQQMLDAGMSVTKAAKMLARAPKVIKEAKAASESQAAMAALDSGQLTLEQAAVIAEFDGDDDAVEALTQAAQRGYFDHAVGQLRVARESAQSRELAGKPYADAGFTVLSKRPTYGEGPVPIYRLHDKDGHGTPEVPDQNQAHLWAVWLEEEPAFRDKETGEVVGEDEVDWSTEFDDDAKPENGLRHANTVTEVTEWVPEYYCLDLEAAGVTLANEDGQGTLSESAAEANAEADTEREKRERRKVLALNKLGAAAQEVRREFVTNLLKRKTPPKGAAIFVAHTLVHDTYLLTTNHTTEVAAELLGVSQDKGLHGLIDSLPPTGDARAQVLTLGLVCSALEARLDKSAWRGGDYIRTQHTPYLKFLTDNGYELSPVEKIITGKAKADKVYDQHLKAVTSAEAE